MNKAKIFAIGILTFLICLSLFPEEKSFYWKGVPGYSGVTVYVEDEFAGNYSKWLDSLDESQQKNYDDIDAILRNLCKRFLEAKNAFEQMGGTLPSCLKEKLNEYFTELKNGTKKLDIFWDTKTPDSYKYLPDQLHGSGLSPANADEIDIWDAYKERFWRIFERKGSKNALTSSLFLHELIHSVKKAYNFKCFQKLPPWKEEFSTDWGCVKVFGVEDSTTGYLDDHPKGWEKDYCTYEIVCKCGDGCPEK